MSASGPGAERAARRPARARRHGVATCPRRSRALPIVVGFVLSTLAPTARAWIYPEHRDIAVQAVTELDAFRRANFDRLWRSARYGSEDRLCADGAVPDQGVTPTCIDWAALSGQAGDHSCSSREMIEQARRHDWALAVADIAAQLKADLARIPIVGSASAGDPSVPGVIANVRRRLADEQSRAQRLNALRAADTRLQRADPRYALRADSNLAHFLLPRSDTQLDPMEYAAQVLRSGAPLNAAGVYVWHHLSALQKADRLADPTLSDDQRRALARAALVDEAFALHFLQDMFAAGHIAGSWGDVSQRKGTHDYYNENGLEVFHWRGRGHSVVVLGDAHMRPEDRKLAADAARNSLAQVLDAAIARDRQYVLPHLEFTSTEPEAFDICTSERFPDRADRLGTGLVAYRAALEEVLLDTFIPGLSPGLGAQPRSRSELGAFVGLVGSVEGRRVNGGFEASQTDRGSVAGIDVGLRAGLGLDGALGDSGDGLAYLQLGYRADGASSNRIVADASGLGLAGAFYAAIPARSGLSLRVRMPYALVPGDLLWASPLALLDREEYTNLAVAASNGGSLGLQRGYATGAGRFQFVLGRELGVVWYGLDGRQELITVGPSGGTLLRLRSVSYDLPIIEYRAFRSFSADQSSTLLFQLVAGIDKPYRVRVEDPPNGPTPHLRSVKWLGMRMTFEWRHYR
jgi:hypothetical protein